VLREIIAVNCATDRLEFMQQTTGCHESDGSSSEESELRITIEARTLGQKAVVSALGALDFKLNPDTAAAAAMGKGGTSRQRVMWAAAA